MPILNKSTDIQLTVRERKDLRLLALFTSAYCEAHHKERPTSVLSPEITKVPGVQKYHFCPECREFLLYAFARRLNCPLEPKPTCKRCKVHCYRPGHREKVREVMRYSGKVLIRRGRLDLLWHFLF